jgi:hypothetical protein
MGASRRSGKEFPRGTRGEGTGRRERSISTENAEAGGTTQRAAAAERSGHSVECLLVARNWDFGVLVALSALCAPSANTRSRQLAPLSRALRDLSHDGERLRGALPPSESIGERETGANHHNHSRMRPKQPVVHIRHVLRGTIEIQRAQRPATRQSLARVRLDGTHIDRRSLIDSSPFFVRFTMHRLICLQAALESAGSFCKAGAIRIRKFLLVARLYPT